MVKFKFSDIGEGLHEGRVAEIYVKEGDNIQEGDAIFSVETDKITSEIPSPATGKVEKLFLKEDSIIHVGDDVAWINDGSGSAETTTEATPPDAEESASVVGEVKVSNELLDFSSLNKKSPKAAAALSSQPIGRRAQIAAERAQKAQASSAPSGAPQGRRAQVAAERAARRGEAPVASQNALSSAPQKIIASEKPSGFVAKREKITSIRKAIARVMTASRDNIVYFSLVHELNVSKLWKLRSEVKDSVLKTTNVKLTFLAFILKAVTIAMQEYPIMGAKFDEKTQELVYPGTVNLGIAVDTPTGLFVPVIHDAHKLSIVELAAEIIRLAKLARDSKLKAGDMRGSTFTVTNYGSVGSYFGTPVINYPDIAIMGTGAIFDAAVIENGEAKVGKAMHLTTAADHRFIDGSTVGRFTSRVKELLENPSLLGVF